MTAVRLSGVSKTYDGGAPALTPTDLTVESGEFFTLLGPSGCGKTTTLRIVAGFESATTGTVSFGDRDVTRLPPERRDLGMVFQNYALFPHLDVANNVSYGLRTRKVPADERTARVAAALDAVGLSRYSTRAVSDLSGGQQQRVALARALVVRPQVLLLDEPLSNLDARLRDETRTQVRTLQREAGITTLYVTHDQAEALAVSDRIAVLSEGVVHQVGTPWEIYHRPATRFVAEFIGNANLLPVRVLSHNGASATAAVGAGVDAPTIRVHPGPDGVRAAALTVAIRPERIGVTPAGTGTLDARIVSAEFLGAHSLYALDTDVDGTQVRLHATVAEDGLNPAPHRPGDVVGLDLSRAEAWAVRA